VIAIPNPGCVQITNLELQKQIVNYLGSIPRTGRINWLRITGFKINFSDTQEGLTAGMLTRPVRHEAEATMYEAED